ncbi:hypothetical protein [Rhizobium leguminosarum]|uniref:Uncharacterized protein n=1 Tax=Rhizobium leguminosarum TaxID=384 RepID=A0A7W9ZQH4_RHILE|nr:hypothetical protein [Rhizobium leguminosarum]MBB6220986.1 hypothetical protein [Rhizobium leguminosarum]
MTNSTIDLSASPIRIPVHFHGVVYNADHFPGGARTKGLGGGANCQQYVYELLRHFGFIVPDFRSSELWEDTEYTVVSETMRRFDLVLVNSRPLAWGAHLGLCLGSELILHLSRRIGLPAIEPLAEMIRRDEYSYFIGAKTACRRCLREGQT